MEKLKAILNFIIQMVKVYVEGLYVNDLKHGKWKYYKKDGTPNRIEEYINGRLQGADPNLISKEQEEKEKEQAKQFKPDDAFEEGFSPHH